MRNGTRIPVQSGATMRISENSFFTSRFAMVMRPEERAMLQAVAADSRMRESELVRKWIVESYTERFGKMKPGA